MASNTTLIEKREELKRRLAAGEYKTLVDIFLVLIDRLARKIIRRSEPLPLWGITVVLSIILSLAIFAAPYIGGGLNSVRSVTASLGLQYGFAVLFGIWVIVVTTIFFTMLNRYLSRIFFLWRNDVLDATEDVASLEEFEDWVEIACNRRLHLLVIIVGSSFAVLYTTIPFGNHLSPFIKYWFTFVGFLISMFVWSFVYQIFVVGLLSANLRRYDLKLFAADPASSELISRLSNELSNVAYLVAVLAAIITLTMALPKLLPFLGILLVLLYWLALIILFALNQISLSSIICRAKWKTLNEIQAKVEKLQAVENFEDKETMEAIRRLMDYHDRVKATRDSALDFRAYLSFFNSLLLPLLAFLLGNLDLVLKLFGRTP